MRKTYPLLYALLCFLLAFNLYGEVDTLSVKVKFEKNIKKQIVDILEYEHFKHYGIANFTNHQANLSDSSQLHYLQSQGIVAFLFSYLKRYSDKSPFTSKVRAWKIFNDYYINSFGEFAKKKYTLAEISTFLRYAPPTFISDYITQKQADNIITWLENVIATYNRNQTLVVTLKPLLFAYQAVDGKNFLQKKFGNKTNIQKISNAENFLKEFAWLLYHGGFLKESLFIYEVYYQHYPSHFQSSVYSGYTLAHLYAKLKKKKKAIFHLKNFIKQASALTTPPEKALRTATLLLAKTYVANRQQKTAYQFFASRLKFYSNDSFYKYYLFLTGLAHPKKYETVKKEYLKKFPNSYYSYVLRRREGIELMEKNKYTQALAVLKTPYALRGRKDFFTFTSLYLQAKNQLKVFFKTKRAPYFDHVFTSYLTETNATLKALHQELVQADEKLMRDILSPYIGKKLTNVLAAVTVSTKIEKLRFPFNYAIESLKKIYWLHHKKDSFVKDFYQQSDKNNLRLTATNFRMHALIGFNHFELAKKQIKILAPNKKDYANLWYEKQFALYSRKNPKYIKQAILRVNRYGSHFNLLPNKLLQLAYPRPLYPFVQYLCEMYGVPIAFVYSIMREESHFQQWAVSSVGARGLMQVMPATGKYLYKKSGLQSARLKIDEEKGGFDLYHEETNIHLGIYYLGLLLKQENSLTKVAASYNAGKRNVERWIKNNRSDPIIFLVSIPYVETDEYVNRVLNSYYVYSRLYRD